MLIGAVDRIIQLATNQGGPSSSSIQGTWANGALLQSALANVGVSHGQQLNFGVCGSAVTTIEEHRTTVWLSSSSNLPQL